MNFDFSDELNQLREQARRFLSDQSSTRAVRRILEGGDTHDRALWQGIADLGWLGAAVPEAYGGVGLSHLELCLAAEELGRALAPVPVASSIYLAAEFLLQAGSEAQKKAWLPRLASGESIGTFAFVEGQGRMTPDKVAAAVRDGRLSGAKSPVPDGDIADLAIVAARSGAGRGEQAISLFLVDLNGPGVTRETLASIDPTRSPARLACEGAPAERLGRDGEAACPAGRPLSRRGRHRARTSVSGPRPTDRRARAHGNYHRRVASRPA